MSSPARPLSGDVWWVDLGRPVGHEQGGRRPALIISNDDMNHGPAGLVIVLPMGSKPKGVPTHVPVEPPEGGLSETSFIRCEDIRTVSVKRLVGRAGTVSAVTMDAVRDTVRVLVDM